ncbi:MAG TPA: hypothetical protein VFZ59_09135 [Verrucomicrobiae bacterium]|nr:hypothetical protein [Verrucomicrobiae bacterium]
MKTRIQIFVGGGLAFLSLRVLALNVINVITNPDIATVIGLLVVSVLVSIGVAILFGSLWAIKAAWVFLVGWFFLQCLGVFMIAIEYPSPQATTGVFWNRLPEAIIPQVALLGLLIWSKHGKFKDERE